MSLLNILFILFGIIALGSAIGILVTRNVIHAAFLLVVCLISFAALYVLYGAIYLAVVQLLVYAGGIVVLLSFGIMLTSRFGGRLVTSNHLLLPGAIMLTGFIFLCAYFFMEIEPLKGEAQSSDDQIQQIGLLFMTDYLMAFELVAYLLLVVLVGASYLAKLAKIK